jgi:hypothetical protein
MLGNPSKEVKGGVCVPASLFHGSPNYTHPSRKVGRSKHGDIKRERLLITPGHIEVEFCKIHQTVGSRGPTRLVYKTREVLDLRSDENAR